MKIDAIIIIIIAYMIGQAVGKNKAMNSVFNYIEDVFRKKGADDTADDILLMKAHFSTKDSTEKSSKKGIGYYLSKALETVLLLLQLGIEKALKAITPKAK